MYVYWVAIKYAYLRNNFFFSFMEQHPEMDFSQAKFSWSLTLQHSSTCWTSSREIRNMIFFLLKSMMLSFSLLGTILVIFFTKMTFHRFEIFCYFMIVIWCRFYPAFLIITLCWRNCWLCSRWIHVKLKQRDKIRRHTLSIGCSFLSNNNFIGNLNRNGKRK